MRLPEDINLPSPTAGTFPFALKSLLLRIIGQTNALADGRLTAHDFSLPSAPTTTNHAYGDKCWNSEPATGEYIGWVYTAAGWKPFGLIA